MNPEYKQLLDGILEGARQYPGSADEIVGMSNYLKSHVSSTDASYLGNILFPELYPPARLPTRFGLPTAAFSHRSHFYLDPNINGNFGLIIFPKAIGSKKGFAFQYLDSAWQDQNWGTASTIKIADDVPDYYDHVRINGCVVRITYMGSLDQMSGVLVGSLDYGYIDGQNSVDVVEDGYYVQRNRTGEGIRCIWLPRDQRDQDFIAADNAEGGDYTQAIMIYGASVPTEGSSKFRVDIERHFEGIPNQRIRDYVELRKASYNAKTLDVLGQIHEKMPHIMTLKMSQIHEVHDVMKNKLGIMDQAIENVYQDGMNRAGALGDTFSPEIAAAGLESLKRMFIGL
jgi:hypothetical protein